METSRISKHLAEQLLKVPAARNGQIKYRPCKVIMKDGRQIDRVYVMDGNTYAKNWGEDPERKHVSIDDVSEIIESPYRLPVHLANKMYGAGESGMGYCIFTLVLHDGRKIPCMTGSAVDFINLPEGINLDMLVDLLPNEGRGAFQNPKGWFSKHEPSSKLVARGAEYFWCCYSAESPSGTVSGSAGSD